MSLIKFKSFDNKFIVEFDDSILNNIHEECIKAGNKETGGILVGNYSKDNYKAIIFCITGPPKDSKQKRCTFNRGIIGLKDLLDKKWKFGHYYLGEWHFHPNSSSQPSTIDSKQMKKLSFDNSLNCSEPILLVIGGNPANGWDLSVHVYKKDNILKLAKIE